MNAPTLKATILGALAAAGGTIATALGGWDMALQTLLILMAIDVVTGVALAVIWKQSPKTTCGGVESNAMAKGLFRKVAALLAVTMAHFLDTGLSTGGWARTTVILFFIANEGLSVIENSALMGVPYPSVIKKALEMLREKADQKPQDLPGLPKEDDAE